MNTPHNLNRIVVGALVSGGLAMAGVGFTLPFLCPSRCGGL